MNMPIQQNEQEFETPPFLISRKDELLPLYNELNLCDEMIVALMDDLEAARKENDALRAELAATRRELDGYRKESASSATHF